MNAALDHPATGHVTVERLRSGGGRVPLNVSHVAYPTLKFSTPSGKIEFQSARAATMGLPPLPIAADTTRGSDGLALSHGRTFAHFHSFYDHGRALPTLASREEAADLWIAPTDARARGVSDGDEIDVSNERGSLRARAKVTGRMPAGAVWIRDGWPGLNALTDGAAVLPGSALDVFAFSVGQSGFGARVDVRPARAK